jgi:hypothetical protein
MPQKDARKAGAKKGAGKQIGQKKPVSGKTGKRAKRHS